MSHEQLMVLGLAVAVDDQVGAVAVGSKQDGLLVDLELGQARALVDCLEQRVCDAVGEANELDVGAGGLPVGADGQDEIEGRFFRAGAVVGQGNVADALVVSVQPSIGVDSVFAPNSHDRRVGKRGRVCFSRTGRVRRVVLSSPQFFWGFSFSKMLVHKAQNRGETRKGRLSFSYRVYLLWGVERWTEFGRTSCWGKGEGRECWNDANLWQRPRRNANQRPKKDESDAGCAMLAHCN